MITPTDSPDEVNYGYNGYENGKVYQADKDKLDLKIDDYRIGRLIDELEEVDKLAKINVGAVAAPTAAAGGFSRSGPARGVG